MNEEFLVERDGVVGHWLRWHLIMAAFVTVCFYIGNWIFVMLRLTFSWFPGTVLDPLDPRFLIVTIPIGIIWGDILYEKDRKANTSKREALDLTK